MKATIESAQFVALVSQAGRSDNDWNNLVNFVDNHVSERQKANNGFLKDMVHTLTADLTVAHAKCRGLEQKLTNES